MEHLFEKPDEAFQATDLVLNKQEDNWVIRMRILVEPDPKAIIAVKNIFRIMGL